MIIELFKKKVRRFLQFEFEKLRKQSLGDQERILIQNGRTWSQLLQNKKIKNIQEAEFKVFSQWGDDGIIQYLVNNLNIEDKIFIEFGVEDYQESNTRFLLINNNWSGLVLDGNVQNISKVQNEEIYWKYDLKAKAAFITAENINNLIEEEGVTGRIGLLHIDIDGNDYWVWKALKIVDPIIVIIEYNSVFGNGRAITIPYKPEFQRTKAHHSNLFAGSSLLAICDLANEKGYYFIGCNSAGNNAYFVKKGYLKDIEPISPEVGYVQSKFRESRNVEGKLTYLGGLNRVEAIRGMKVYNTRSNEIEYL